MEFAKQIERALLSAYPEASVSADVDSVGKISAIIVWPGFALLTDRVRQQSVWGHLLQQFKADELRRISLILTSTPEEDELLRDYPPGQD